MAKASIFYSWQSDLPNATNRSFIEECLQKAINELKIAGGVHLDPCLDRDTRGVAGSPDIAATILDKINAAEIFVCDVSLLQKESRPSPNPNVLFELGYAVRRLGWDRIICVINEHFGSPNDLPFDIRQRRVRPYRLEPDSDQKPESRKRLVSSLRDDIIAILATKAELGSNLKLQFGDPRSRTPGGAKLALSSVLLPYNADEISDYRPTFNNSFFPIDIPDSNHDYWRDVAKYIHLKLLLQPVGFVLYNGNSKTLNDVILEVELPKSHGLVVQEDEPIKPSKSNIDAMSQGVNPIWTHFETLGDARIRDLVDRYHIVVKFGKMHAEANAWSSILFVGASETCEIPVAARILSDELASPQSVPLTLCFQVDERSFEELGEEVIERLLEDLE